MKLKMDELREIIKIIEAAKINVLQLEKGDFKLYYQKDGGKNIQLNHEEGTFDLSDVTAENDLTDTGGSHKELKTEDKALHQITSPMIGAFYSRPNPDADPFVKLGTKISKNDTVCVLEAMKLLNEITSDVNGEIVEILAEDGEIIEFGQPLFTVKVSE